MGTNHGGVNFGRRLPPIGGQYSTPIFWQVSYGFRPGRGCHGALEHIRRTIRPNKYGADGKRRDPPYQWVIEGDIEGCFDNIGHHVLMERVRKSVADRKVNRLIVSFLKAGVLEDFLYSPTDTGTPQGGVLSPLLANIALSAIEERYWRWVRHPHDPKFRSSGALRAAYRRQRDREAGRPVFYPVRYADDFLIFVTGSFDDAAAERQALADWLREEMGLTLSEEKTRITKLTEGFRFLGCQIRLKWGDRYGYGSRVEIPKEVVNDFRWRIKKMLKQHTRSRSLQSMLQEINPLLRGWSGYYRYCIGAKPILSALDWYVSQRFWLWLRSKHKDVPRRKLFASRLRSSRAHPGTRVWADGDEEQYVMAFQPVMRFQLKWMKSPDFALAFGKPDA